MRVCLRKPQTNARWLACLIPTTSAGGCSAVFELRGDYKRAFNYIYLGDPRSEWPRTHLIELLLHQGKEREAMEVGPTHIAQWESFNMLRACAARKPLPEIVALASAVLPQDDPE